jgi:hypothetical protein
MSRSFLIDFREALLMDMSGCECKPDAKRKRDSAQPEAKGAAIKNRCAARTSIRWLRDVTNRPVRAVSPLAVGAATPP